MNEFPLTSHSSNWTRSPVKFPSAFENPPQCGFDLSFRTCDEDELSITELEGRPDLEAYYSTELALLGTMC